MIKILIPEMETVLGKIMNLTAIATLTAVEEVSVVATMIVENGAGITTTTTTTGAAMTKIDATVEDPPTEIGKVGARNEADSITGKRVTNTKRLTKIGTIRNLGPKRSIRSPPNWPERKLDSV